MLSIEDKTKGEVFLNTLSILLRDNETRVNICPHRDKNFVFYYLYNINEAYIRSVLSELTIDDLQEIIENTNPNFPKKELYVFSKDIVLCNAAQEEVGEKLYIKISIDEKGKIITTISFHDAKYSF